MKQIIKKELKFVGRKLFGASIGAVAFVVVAGAGMWALAAFTEPTDTPGNSVQDWAKNIIGANNSDNAFDSAAVTANSDGSIVERLEAIEGKISGGGVTAMSARSAYSLNHSSAAQYCFDLSATAEVVNTGSDTSTTYTDWRLGSISEMSVFENTISATDYLWTATIYGTSAGNWLRFQMGGGYWHYSYFSASNYVRCVR